MSYTVADKQKLATLTFIYFQTLISIATENETYKEYHSLDCEKRTLFLIFILVSVTFFQKTKSIISTRQETCPSCFFFELIVFRYTL